MRARRYPRPTPALAIFAVGCVLALAACGGSSSSKPQSAISASQGLRYADCMRAHGVTNFPDPNTGGGGFQIKIDAGSGVNPQSPSFQSAQSACSKLLPFGGPGRGHPTEQDRLAMLHVAQCMRAHGLTNFPDPTTTPPRFGSGLASLVLGRDGVFLVLPSSISPSSPAFTQAARACHFPVPAGGH
jgi:hypothetical protein